MTHAFQVGIIKIFAVTPKGLKLEILDCSRPTTIGYTRLFSNSLPISSTVTDNNDKKLKGSMVSSRESDKSILKEISVKGKVLDVQSIRDDMGKLETMTVQELRTTLRSMRVPAKGCKSDLISTFKGVVEQGESFIAAYKDESASAKCKLVKSKSVSHKDKDIESALEVSVKKDVNQLPFQDETLEAETETLTAKKNLSIRTFERREPPRSKRKVASDEKTEDVKADGGQKLAVNLTEPWTVLAHKKPKKGWIPYNPRTMRPRPPECSKSVKLMSWNVNGLRALLKLEGFSALQLAQRENFDVLCLQETKLQEKDVEKIKQCLIDGYDNSFWTCSISKLGYSGTAIVSRIKPISVRYGLGIPDHDTEGRLVTVEFDSFFLLCGYVPNSGDGLKRLSYRVEQWDTALSSYMKELEKSKPVILTGDLNCAHEEIDIYNPAGNKRSAGFTDEERRSFETNFLSKGFVDTFRKQHPGVVGYTYWGFRHGGRKTNRGWRLDYFLVSESIADNVHDSFILPDVMGSDHCPIGLVLKL